MGTSIILVPVANIDMAFSIIFFSVNQITLFVYENLMHWTRLL